jgi:hypothetical protein
MTITETLPHSYFKFMTYLSCHDYSPQSMKGGLEYRKSVLGQGVKPFAHGRGCVVFSQGATGVMVAVTSFSTPLTAVALQRRKENYHETQSI